MIEEDDIELSGPEPDGEPPPNALEFVYAGKKYHPDATLSEQVSEVARLLRSGQWLVGTAARLAKKWPNATPKHIQAVYEEAARRVISEAGDPDQVKAMLTSALQVNLHRATSAGKFDSVTRTADILSRITGSRAPERHEHAVIIAQFEQMTTVNKIRFIDDRIAKLAAQREELVQMSLTEGDPAAALNAELIAECKDGAYHPNSHNDT